MTTWKWAAFAAVMIITASCHKDHTSMPPPAGNDSIPFVTRIEKNANTFSTYWYSGQGPLIRYNQVLPGTVVNYRVLYDEGGRLSGLETPDYRTRNIYTGDRVTRIELINIHQDPDNNVADTYSDLIYTAGRMTEILTYALINGTPFNYERTTYEYFANGDLKTLKDWQYNDEEQQILPLWTMRYEYDDKKSPWERTGAVYPWLYNIYTDLNDFLPAAHNVTKETNYDGHDVMMAYRTYDYTYLQNGFPSSAVERWTFADPDEPSTTDTVKYTYR